MKNKPPENILQISWPWNDFSRTLHNGNGGRSNTSNSQSWQRLHQVFNFLINQGEKEQVSGADKVIQRRKSRQPWKKKTYPHSTYDWKRSNRTGVGDIVLACNPSTWEVWDRKVATRSCQSAWPMWCDGSCQLSRIGIHLEVSLSMYLW